MRSGSRWSHVVRTVVIFVLVGVVAGAIVYFAVPGSHTGNLTYAIIVGAVVAGFSYFRYRARQTGRALRDLHEDQLGQGGRPLPPGQGPIVDENRPQRQ